MRIQGQPLLLLTTVGAKSGHGKNIAVVPESLHGPERERAWARVVALAPS